MAACDSEAVPRLAELLAKTDEAEGEEAPNSTTSKIKEVGSRRPAGLA